MWRLGVVTALVGAVLLVGPVGQAAAQDQTPPPPPPPPQTGTSTTTGSTTGSTSSTDGQTGASQTPQTPPSQTFGQDTKEPKKDKKQDRLFFVLPNYVTVQNEDNVPPLTAGQKYALVAEGGFDWVEYPWYAFTAEISQANNSEPTLGSGWDAYAKRYALNFVDGTSENFLVGAVLPGVLHQDPRYYQMGKGGFWKRAGYCLSRIAVTRSDSGQSQVNYSEILGSGLAAGLTNLYHPKADRTLGNTLSTWKTLVGYDTLTLFFREFWPDMRKVF